MKSPRILSSVVALMFFINGLGPLPQAYAQELVLPKPGVRVHLSPPLNPPLLKGIKVYNNDPFKFDFVLSQGDSAPAEALAKEGYLKQESNRLIRYFLASLTVPDKDLWVNLSPYEKDRIIPNAFGQTEMGRDLLAQDYLLKQITASLIYPEEEVGREFWNKVYSEAQKKFGTTNIPVNTFNKVWIVPAKAVVYENISLPQGGEGKGGGKQSVAYVVEAKLKVMLEQDYLALEKNSPPLEGGVRGGGSTGALGSQIIREIVIPQLEQEVNEGKNFAPLRQVYHSLILAAWYKQKIKQSILAKVYADKNKVAGVNYTNTVIPAEAGIQQQSDIDAIYQQYLQAFKKGVFNYIKDPDPTNVGSGATSLPRKYFSGGVAMAMTSLANPAMVISNKRPQDLGYSRAMLISAGVSVFTNSAMSAVDAKYLNKPIRGIYPGGIDLKIFDIFPNLSEVHFINTQPFRVLYEKNIGDLIFEVSMGNVVKGEEALKAMKKTYLEEIFSRSFVWSFTQEKIVYGVLSSGGKKETPQIGMEPFMLAELERRNAKDVNVKEIEPGVFRIEFKDQQGLARVVYYHQRDVNDISNTGVLPELMNSGVDLLFLKGWPNDFPERLEGSLRVEGILAIDDEGFTRQGYRPLGIIGGDGSVFGRLGHSDTMKLYEYTSAKSANAAQELGLSGQSQAMKVTYENFFPLLFKQKYVLINAPSGKKYLLTLQLRKSSKGDYKYLWIDAFDVTNEEQKGIRAGTIELGLVSHKQKTLFASLDGPDEHGRKSLDDTIEGPSIPSRYSIPSGKDIDRARGKYEQFGIRVFKEYQNISQGGQTKDHLGSLLYVSALGVVKSLGVDVLTIISGSHFFNSFDTRLFHEGKPRISFVLLNNVRRRYKILTDPEGRVVLGFRVSEKSSPAQLGQAESLVMTGDGVIRAGNKTGGIDLSFDKAMQIKNDGQGEIKFQIDPALFKQWQEAPGVVPVIFNIEPMNDIYQFLGVPSVN